jgi:hypothetical protein
MENFDVPAPGPWMGTVSRTATAVVDAASSSLLDDGGDGRRLSISP